MPIVKRVTKAATGLIVGTLGLAGCTGLPPTRDTLYLPPGVFGVYLDNDTGAINQAAWAFASPANTRGNPIEAARAVVALEYLPGELKSNPRWVGMDAAIPFRMRQARDQVQQTLGIAPTVPPQLVVNALLAVAANLQFGNRTAALQALRSPAFTYPPEQTLGILSNLPYVQEANLSTSRASSEMLASDGSRS